MPGFLTQSLGIMGRSKGVNDDDDDDDDGDDDGDDANDDDDGNLG